MGLLGSLKSLLTSKLDVAKRFELLREAISGTMSSFHMARDRQSGKIVGLKLHDPGKAAAFEARFKGLKKPSEGEIGKAIHHPNVVETLEYGLTTTGQYYVVLEFLDGPGLNSAIVARDRRLDGRRVDLLRQAAEALRAVHQAGYIHHDICPRNFVCSQDLKSLKLIDFGLTVPATPEFLKPGNRTGTPNYMPPEVIHRRKNDLRLDIFSFGATAFELCTFELPWARGATGQAALAHDTATDIRTLRPRIQPRLAEAINRSLIANPDQRLASMDQFLKLLSELKSEDVPA
jgi:eukaryotic-like serine/threonine-protein kinase